MKLDLLLRVYSGRGAVRSWLDALADLGPDAAAPGWSLVQEFPGADNVASVDRVLGALEAAGWIRRGVLRPSVSQLFFDVNGEMRRGAQPSGFEWILESGSWPLAAYLGRVLL